MTIGKALLGFALFAGSSVAFSFPSYIDSSGREWLDLNESRQQNWYELASVCSVADGACNGSLDNYYGNGGTADPAGLDLTGYTWASRDEVRSLFYELAVLPAGSLDDYSASFARSDGYGANLFSKMDETISLGSSSILNGFTRTVGYNPELGFTGFLGTVFGPSNNPNQPSGATDTFDFNEGSLSSGVFKFGDMSIGAYLFRPSSISVSEPGGLALFAAAGIALFAFRRRLPRLKRLSYGPPSRPNC